MPIHTSKPVSIAGPADARPRLIVDGVETREAILAARSAGKSVGLVPTMGALHEGHLSLVDAAREQCDLVVATIFVNPAQFAPNEDFRRYPRDLDRDLEMLGERACDLVFVPTSDAMYPPGYATFVDVGPVGNVLEGEHRPTHFRGVATIVLKLFQLAPASRAYFGRKDYQQVLVVRQMVRDLNVPIEVQACPIVRDSDGLAMSSRNRYLTPDERARAAAIPRSLRLAERLSSEGETRVAEIRGQMLCALRSAAGIDVQYIAFVADGTIDSVETITGPTTVAIACVVGTTRLIDNTIVNCASVRL